MKGKTASDQTARRAARAEGVAIPPAWTDVVYHGKDKGVIAEGRDEKGRKQRSENPEYRQGISDANNADVQAFGASNLMGDHVSNNEAGTHFDFLGKKGVRQQHSVSDPVIAGFTQQRAWHENLHSQK